MDPGGWANPTAQVGVLQLWCSVAANINRGGSGELSYRVGWGGEGLLDFLASFIRSIIFILFAFKLAIWQMAYDVMHIGHKKKLSFAIMALFWKNVKLHKIVAFIVVSEDSITRT